MKPFFLLLTLFSLFACSKVTPIPKNSPLVASYVEPDYLKTLNFKDKELLALKIDGQFYYIHKSGKKMLTLTQEGSADKFSDGLARTKVNGKVGFFNKNLEMILAPIYDFAFPFHNGMAEICIGCKETEEDGENMLDGGTWKKINRSGLVIE